MKRTDIITGFSCNNNCLFCMLGDDYKKLGQRKKQELLKDIKKATGNCITFCGGEPTIHKDILELVKAAKRAGFKEIHAQTNARMLSYPDFCQNLINAGVNSFTVSLHAHNEKLGNQLSQTKNSFQQTVDGIKNLKKYNARLITNTVINKKNYKYLPAIISLAISLKADQIQLVFIRPRGRAYKNFNQLIPLLKNILPYLKKSIQLCNSSYKTILVEGIPLCIIPQYEKHIAEKYMPSTQLKAGNHPPSKKIKRKVKFQKCKSCFYDNKCEGIWTEYTDKFGNKEFKPLNHL